MVYYPCECGHQVRVEAVTVDNYLGRGLQAARQDLNNNYVDQAIVQQHLAQNQQYPTCKLELRITCLQIYDSSTRKRAVPMKPLSYRIPFHRAFTIGHLTKNGKSAEMLWRLSRALYHMSKEASLDEAKAMIYEAYDLVSKALSLGDDNSAVHKWYAILLDGKSRYEGKKAQIQQLQTVKDHMLRSYELNSKDATILYLLGNWCYHVSDLAWYQREIAAAIFATPPNSSFEEALQFLLKAEEIDPNFYSQNLLLIGKTCLKLNRKEDAARYLKISSEYPARNNDDRDANQEAAKLLGSLSKIRTYSQGNGTLAAGTIHDKVPYN